MFSVLNYRFEENRISLSFKSEIEFENLKLELRFKDMERFIGAQAYEYYYPVELKSEGLVHIADIPLLEIVRKRGETFVGDQLVWLYVLAEEKSVPLKADKDYVSSGSQIVTLSQNLSFTTLINKKSEFQFKILMEKFANTIGFSTQNNETTFEIQSSLSEINVHLRKRVFKDAGIHSLNIPLPHKENGFVLKKDILGNLMLEDEITIFDFIVEGESDGIRFSNFGRVEIPDKLPIPIDFGNRNYNGELYKTNKGNMALKISRKYPTGKIDHIVEAEPGKYEIILSIQMEGQAIVCRYNKLNFLSPMDNYIQFKSIPLLQDEREKTYFELNMDELFGEIEANYEQRYRIILQSKDGIQYKLGLKEPLYTCFPTSKNNIYLEGEKVFNIFVRGKQENGVKIGVLGSCFSRSQFNSQDKFYKNNDYKLAFNVCFSQFWPSIISLVSKPIKYDESELANIAPKKMGEIKREMDKTILSDIKDANVDYLIIDFYVDVIHGVRKFEDGTYLGINPYIRSTGYYKNKVLKTSRQMDYRDPDYFRVWKQACDEFLERVQEFLPEKRLVLNTGGLIDRYYDKDRNVKNFIEEKIISRKSFINYNSLWEKMNQYFLTKAPNAKLLDMQRYGYIGDIKHPSPFGPHHYESAYYRGMTGELARIIVFDQNR